ncbi:alanine racemase [Pleionea mediterranea]|uniref:Alanine racemase n=1 Tax=Pleionea mediterranea TaxID=523701 RepID=A0A316FFR5_9GAMM|nr:alanine racemase [Pleionea mediterranea]PWK47259.1 alanine racemase [Pleionea mediterranea]
MRPTRAIIHLDAITHNLAMIRQMAPNSQIMAVVKADAYSHGIVQVAEHLSQADCFAVACIEEAIQLREGGISQPIVLLEGYFEAEELALIDRYDLQTVIHSQYQIDWLLASKLSGSLTVWLKFDSQMNRLGFNPENFTAALKQLESSDQVSEIKLMTHFACADDIASYKTEQQNKQFVDLTADMTVEKTAANSAAILAWPETHYDWVRPGIMLYGCSPLLTRHGAQHQLKPAMTLESQVIAIKQVKKGETAGYGAHWVAAQDTRLAVVAIGYGDGYPRHAENGTPVWINGREVPLAGRVSMDMIAVDIGLDSQDEVGDRVVLWGEELPVEVVAQSANTIPYTLLCGVTSRVKLIWQES